MPRSRTSPERVGLLLPRRGSGFQAWAGTVLGMGVTQKGKRGQRKGPGRVTRKRLLYCLASPGTRWQNAPPLSSLFNHRKNHETPCRLQVLVHTHRLLTLLFFCASAFFSHLERSAKADELLKNRNAFRLATMQRMLCWRERKEFLGSSRLHS